MSALCDNIQELLADDPSFDLEGYPEAISHIESCQSCRAFRAALRAIEGHLSELPQLSPPPGTIDGLFERLAAAPAASAAQHASGSSSQPALLMKDISVIFAQLREYGQRDDYAKRLVTTLSISLVFALALSGPSGILMAFKVVGSLLSIGLAIGMCFLAHNKRYSEFTIYSVALVITCYFLSLIAGGDLHISAMLLILVMLFAIFISCMGRYGTSIIFAGMAGFAFISRSMMSTFFNDVTVSDGGSIYSYQGMERLNSGGLSGYYAPSNNLANYAQAPPSVPAASDEQIAKWSSEEAQRIEDVLARQEHMRNQKKESLDSAPIQLMADASTLLDGGADPAEGAGKLSGDRNSKSGSHYLDDLEKTLGFDKGFADRRSLNEFAGLQDKKADNKDLLALAQPPAKPIPRGQSFPSVGAGMPSAPEPASPSDTGEELFEADLSPENEAIARGDEVAVSGAKRKALQGDELLSESVPPKEQAAAVSAPKPSSSISPAGRESDVLAAFLRTRSQIEGLRYKEPQGYWANTYLPGDPAFIALLNHARSAGRKALKPYVDAGQIIASFQAKLGMPPAQSPDLSLEDLAQRPAQPFDAPTSSALAVYMHSDQTGITGKSRMLVQVGLQATKRAGGSRPAMNVALVLDMRNELPDEEKEAIRSLVVALEKAREVGDRFSLTVAGREGGIIIKPGEFRHGTVEVALRQLLGSGVSKGGLEPGDALRSAIQAVKNSDDPNSPLGSSMVIFATSQPLQGLGATLGSIAHEGAVGGIPVSVIGIGQRAVLRELDSLALAGQGNRRILTGRDALDLVARELSSLGKVVARAVRLRIRLAPGVKLVDVVASRRLDEIQAQRVRDAEKSVDMRISRNLGIQADRGEDEEGIQIVIPAFHAGDSHVVLLDVVAPGPGPISEVTVRYKDLVYMNNGVARGNLDLGRYQSASGPLELNVMKNLLALQLSAVLESEGRRPPSDDERLGELLHTYSQLLKAIQQHYPPLRTDADLLRDVAMLDGYLEILTYFSEPGVSAETREQFSSSLRLASRLKVLPKPTLDK